MIFKKNYLVLLGVIYELVGVLLVLAFGALWLEKHYGFTWIVPVAILVGTLGWIIRLIYVLMKIQWDADEN